MTALHRDIQRAYPGKYKVHVYGNFKAVWNNNPHVAVTDGTEDGQQVHMDYGRGIRESNKGDKSHFLSWFHKAFEERTGIHVPVTEPKGELFLTDEEKAWRPVEGRYWAIVAGGKIDATVKVWNAGRWQQTVDILKAHGIHCVQLGDITEGHFHPQLKNVTSLVGQTPSIRKMFGAIHNAEGVICGVTGAMHIAAAMEKPCVVIGGGREAPSWESYTNCFMPDSFGPTCAPVKVEHRFLHTIGLIDCGIGNLAKGCWKNRTVPLTAKDRTNAKMRDGLCRRPVRENGDATPECMLLIHPDHVVEAVMSYYELGILPPVGKPTGRYSLPLISGYDLVRSGAPAEAPDTSQEPAGTELMDNPIIGGKFTVFVLCYGKYTYLAKRCINSILSKTPPHRLDLRVMLNQPCRETEEYIDSIKDHITKVYTDHSGRKKYQAMREAFWDKDCPINTKWLVWLDDDSFVTDADWFAQMAKSITDNYHTGARQFGIRAIHPLKIYMKNGHDPMKFFRESPWWKNQWLFADKGRRLAPNGSDIVFALGSYWMMSTEAMREGNIPDPRLVHAGGDILNSAVIHQLGYKIKDFGRQDRPVCYDDHDRRGGYGTFLWAPDPST